MENAAVGELEQYMKVGFKLARRTKDPNALKEMYKHFEEAIREQYGSRKPANAAKRIPVPAALLSKELGIEQIEVDEDSSSSSTSSVPMATTSKSIVEVCSSPPPTITLEQAKLDPVINIDSDSDMETDNIESYSCCKCKEGSLGKNLVECQECHSMYHQNCHVPPITDINLNDPRIVWYCGSCRQKTESRSLGKESKKSSKNTSGIKAEKLSGNKSSQNAKSVSGKSKSSSANSSPKHPFTATSSSAMSAAEKRVQMMKKKATKKTDKKK